MRPLFPPPVKLITILRVLYDIAPQPALDPHTNYGPEPKIRVGRFSDTLVENVAHSIALEKFF